VPGFAGVGKRLAQLAQDRCEGRVADAVVGGRDELLERVAVADGVDDRAVGAGNGDVVEHVAHQALGDDGRAFHEAAHLGVDAPAQALGGRVGRDGLLS